MRRFVEQTEGAGGGGAGRSQDEDLDLPRRTAPIEAIHVAVADVASRWNNVNQNDMTTPEPHPAATPPRMPCATPMLAWMRVGQGCQLP